MPHLLDLWPSVSQRLRACPLVLLLFDYDGTLTPIVERPELALLPPETRQSLVRLSRRQKYVVGIISARSLEDVAAKVAVDGLLYAGNHGLEMRGLGLDFVHPEAERSAGDIEQAYELLQIALAPLKGVFTEHKGLSLTVHYRQAQTATAATVKDTVEKAISGLVQSGVLTVSTGKMAFEIRPRLEWDKGKAISWVIAAYPPDTLALFFGDDRPDEAGFAAVQDAGGLGIFVGAAREATVAVYRVDSPQEVGQVLAMLARL